VTNETTASPKLPWLNPVSDEPVGIVPNESDVVPDESIFIEEANSEDTIPFDTLPEENAGEASDESII